jgi:hypothetical protein
MTDEPPWPRSMSFCFRLRFRTATKLAGGRKKKFCVSIPTIDRPVIFAAEIGTFGTSDWAVAKSCGYSSEAHAKDNGKRLRDALVVVGAVHRRGIDCGFDRGGLKLSQAIVDSIREAQGFEPRGSLHGLDVFEEGTVVPVVANARISVHSSPEVLLKDIQHVIGLTSAAISERQQICASLINDSFFVPNMDIRFVLCVFAVEALCGTKKMSVRQAFLKKLRELLGQPTAKRFDELYGLRSKLVHKGVGRGRVGQFTDEVLEIAISLLQADLAHSTAKSVAIATASVVKKS